MSATTKRCLISDIFPTGWFGAELAGIHPGAAIAVFGCGPVGQLVIASARLMNAGRIIAVDRHDDRLDMPQRQGAEIVNFDREDPVKTILDMTDGIGVDRAVDAVGWMLSKLITDLRPPLRSGPRSR